MALILQLLLECAFMRLFRFMEKIMDPQKYTLRQLTNDLGFASVQELQTFAQKAPYRYGEVSIPKDKQNPEKGSRVINPPDKELKKVQRLLLRKVLSHIDTLGNMGAGRGSSTAQIMALHTNKDMLLCYDISNFFPSVKKRTIKKSLRDRGFSWDIIDIIANLTTFNNHLPQGGPCSTQLGKIILSSPAKHLLSLLENYGTAVDVSFWVDDIVISGPRSLENLEKYGNVYNIFSRHGFQLKREKTKIQPKSDEQNALGLRVDRGIVEPDSDFMFSYSTEISLNGRNSKRARGMRNYMESIHVK